MCKHNRTITFLLFFALLLVEIICIFLNIVVLLNALNLEESSLIKPVKDYLLIKSVLNILANTISIIMILVFGIYSSYFKIKSNLLIYIIFAAIDIVIILISESVDLYTDFRNKLGEIHQNEATQILSIYKVFNYLMVMKSLLYLFSLVMVCFMRKVIIRDYESSPLLIVDDSLTEELYNDIIQQSMHPDENSNEVIRIRIWKSGARSGEFSNYYNSSSKDSGSINYNRNGK